jgi:hypothetical protein
MGLIASPATELWKRLARTSLDGYDFRLGMRFLGWIQLLYGRTAPVLFKQMTNRRRYLILQAFIHIYILFTGIRDIRTFCGISIDSRKFIW